MNRIIVSVMAVCFLFVAVSILSGRVKDTPHNLNLNGVNVPNQEVCRPCHAPHRTNVETSYLWNHELSDATWTLHEGADLESVASSTSRLCLSCHDGTVAIDSFGTHAGTDFINYSGLLGTDLRSSHPIGVEYPANAFRYIQPDSDGKIISEETPDGSYASLEDGKVQCSSCHYAHGSRAAYGMFLRIDNTGSALCMTCHRIPG